MHGACVASLPLFCCTNTSGSSSMPQDQCRTSFPSLLPTHSPTHSLTHSRAHSLAGLRTCSDMSSAGGLSCTQVRFLHSLHWKQPW
jgi:hypothetical protein